jgi:hypothetical protein
MHVCSSSSERGLPVGLRARVGGARGRGVRGAWAAVRREEAALSRPGKQSPRDESLSSASWIIASRARCLRCRRRTRRAPVARTDSYCHQNLSGRRLPFTHSDKRWVFAAAIT